MKPSAPETATGRPFPRAGILLLAAALALAVAARAEVVERVIVRVNGDILTQTEFEARQLAAVQQARLSPSQVEAYLRENNARLLQEAIDDLLLEQKGVQLGIRMRPEYIKELIEGIKKDNGIQSEDDFQAQLRREGMTVDDLKRSIERSIVRRQVLARDVPATPPTEAEVRAEYDARVAEYTHAASAHLLGIALPAAAIEQAQQIVEKARQGADFLELAREHSLPGKGGDLGRISRGDLSPALEKVVFGLAAGAISDPVPAPDGLRIFKVVEQSAATLVAFVDVKAEIERKLAQDRQQKQYESYMEGLRKGAIIDVRVREVALQVNGSPTASPLLEPPPASAPKPVKSVAPVKDDAEFENTTSQTGPERVAAPPPIEAKDTPAASPAPPR